MVITLENIKEFLRKIQLDENSLSSDDVYLIAYRIDCFNCGDEKIIMKHIDIEFDFGECYEIHEGEELYNYIYELCNLDEIKEAEKILYMK